MRRLSAAQSLRLEQLSKWVEGDAPTRLRAAGAGERPLAIERPHTLDTAESERLAKWLCALADAQFPLGFQHLLHWVLLAGRYPQIGCFEADLEQLQSDGFARYFEVLWERASRCETGAALQLAPVPSLLIDVTETLAIPSTAVSSAWCAHCARRSRSKAATSGCFAGTTRIEPCCSTPEPRRAFATGNPQCGANHRDSSRRDSASGCGG
jgi:hypothetical protein